MKRQLSDAQEMIASLGGKHDAELSGMREHLAKVTRAQKQSQMCLFKRTQSYLISSESDVSFLQINLKCIKRTTTITLMKRKDDERKSKGKKQNEKANT